MRKICLILLVQIAALFAQGQFENEINLDSVKVGTVYNWLWREGDNYNWSQPNNSLMGWSQYSTREPWLVKKSETPPVRWYRAEVLIKGSVDTLDALSLHVPAVISSYEIFWDGELVGRSGSDTRMGDLAKSYILHESATAEGVHTLALRIVNQSKISGGILRPIQIGYHSEMYRKRQHALGLAYFLAGIFFITGVFHILVLTYPGRRAPNIIFSLFSFSCAGNVIIDSMVRYNGIGVESYYWLALIDDFFWSGMVILLPVFMLSHFKATHRNFTGILFAVFTLIVVAIPRLATYDILPISWLPFLDSMNLFYGYFSVLFAILIVFGATLKKREGSKTILSGLFLLFAGLALTRTYGLLNGWALGFVALNIFITIAIARQLREQLNDFHRAELKAARLELELLKQHIQPHFLLNTLNSIVAWIEEEPVVATELVNALSRELRFLMAFAGEALVPLSEEIKLCRAHLNVMNMRKEKELSLSVKGSVEKIMVPPLILHTLVESGITHGFSRLDKGEFVVSVTKDEKWTELTIENSGSSEGDVNSVGTGGKYVRSRLTESFGDEWYLDSEPLECGWKWTLQFKER